MITAMDDVLGNLTQKLKEVGIYENTVIVFSSDNGGLPQLNGNLPLKGNVFIAILLSLLSNIIITFRKYLKYLCKSVLYTVLFKLGYKNTLYEGGTRVPGFIHSPLLHKSKYVSQALMHVTDWYPTFLRLAGMPNTDVQALNLDGIDQYDTFFSSEANGDKRCVFVLLFAFSPLNNIYIGPNCTVLLCLFYLITYYIFQPTKNDGI